MKPAAVGLDVGSTHVKAAVVDVGGRVLAVARAPTPLRPDGVGMMHPFDELLGAAEAVVREAVTAAAPVRIAGLGIASVAESGLPVDAAGEPLDDVLAWFDPRPAPQARMLAATVGAPELFVRTGLRPEPKVTLAKLAWLRDERPDVARRMAEWRFVADAVAGSWTGGSGTSATLACRSMAWDLRRRTWDEELLALVGLRSEQMPPLVPWTSPVGAVRAAAAARLGVAAGLPVAVAGHDHVVGALAAGAVGRGDVVDSIGTAEALLLVTDVPALDEEVRLAGFSVGSHVLDGRSTLIGGLQASGAFIDWFLTALAGVAPDADPDVRSTRLLELVALAARRPSGIVAQATLRGRTAPLPDASATASFSGLTAADGLPELALAALEGTAFHARWLVDELGRLAGVAPARIRVIGGGARNEPLLAVKAALTPAPLEVLDEPEAVAVGAGFVGLVAAGTAPSQLVTDRAPAVRVVTATRSERAAYADAYAAFRRLVVMAAVSPSSGGPPPRR